MNGGRTAAASEWVEGPVEASFWTGVKLRGRERRREQLAAARALLAPHSNTITAANWSRRTIADLRQERSTAYSAVAARRCPKR